jgi:acyl-[acyl-carrier-protein]-phospholipid O-acyltransferase/long-chain-fatty-acid--[acyl-carrier-protein] ligase
MMLIHQQFVRTAKARKSKLAFVDRGSDWRITYSMALTLSLAFAGKVKEYDEGFIGIMLPTSAVCSTAILGSLMSGRTPVMINYSTGADSNARYAQKKCSFKTIITSRKFIAQIDCPFVVGMIFIEDIMESISILEKVKALIIARLPVPLILKRIHGGNENDNSCILFTSGSEKDPKAVQLTHRNIASNVKNFSKVIGLHGNDIILANLPFFHVFGLTVNLWTPLYYGMTIISYPNPVDYKMICNIIREEKPTMMAGTPSFLSGYLRKSEPGDFASIRFAVSGADKCPGSLREGFLEKHGITLYEGYGATETSPVVSVNSPDDNRPGSIGRVLPDVEVRIEDSETGMECGSGETGRIMVKGDIVMKGYFDDHEETSLRIRNGWYDTGDMGFIDEDGYLWHAGRLKRFVKVGGEMVSLVKVEDVLSKVLPGDVSCCVVGVPDALKGAKIFAAVTQEVDRQMVMREISKDLPNIALPKQFIVIEELPKMGSGKVDFRLVEQMVENFLKEK